MKKSSLLYLLALLVMFGATAPVIAEESMADMDKRCRSYAEEDRVAADELEDYVKECIQSIKQDEAEPAAETEAEPEAEPDQR